MKNFSAEHHALSQPKLPEYCSDYYRVERRYYTPSIQEFCVGLECEKYSEFDREFRSIEFELAHLWEFWHGMKMLDKKPVDFYNYEQERNEYLRKNYKVRYLDRMDIEGLGFVERNVPRDRNMDSYVKGSFVICHQPQTNKLEVYEDMHGELSPIFIGTIKNVSELKKLLIQVGVH